MFIFKTKDPQITKPQLIEGIRSTRTCKSAIRHKTSHFVLLFSCQEVKRTIKVQHSREKEKNCRYPQFGYTFTTWIERYEKNFKATDGSLCKTKLFTVNEICMNFQPYFFLEELREAPTLKSSSALITHGRKQSLAHSKSTCTKQLTIAISKYTLLFSFFSLDKKNQPYFSPVYSQFNGNLI